MEAELQWVQAAQGGDDEAFARLWHTYQFSAQQWAFHHVRDFDETEEIVQAAFAEAYRQLETLRNPAQFSAWLRGIVVRLAISAYRRRTRTTTVENIDMVIEDGVPISHYNYYEIPAPDALAEERERHQLLEVALKKLPPRYQRALQLFYCEELSQEKVAEILHTTVSAVKGLLHRGRHKLKEEIKDNGQKKR